MINNCPLSILQLICIVCNNLIGLGIIFLIFYISKRISVGAKRDIYISLLVSILAQGILIVALVDVGILLWIETDNPKSILSPLPFFLCLFPPLFFISFLGTFLQLRYGELIRNFVVSSTKR